MSKDGFKNTTKSLYNDSPIKITTDPDRNDYYDPKPRDLEEKFVRILLV